MNTFKSKRYNVILAGAVVMLLVGALSGCSSIKTEAKYPENRNSRDQDSDIYSEQKSIFGDKGGLFGGDKKARTMDNAIGVNGFLWRATLDTISFMPLASADPFGGVILTDYYMDPKKPGERVKLNAFVMGRELKADNIRVRAFRQVKKRSGWEDAPVAAETARKLEDAVLMRARELRVAHIADEE